MTTETMPAMTGSYFRTPEGVYVPCSATCMSGTCAEVNAARVALAAIPDGTESAPSMSDAPIGPDIDGDVTMARLNVGRFDSSGDDTTPPEDVSDESSIDFLRGRIADLQRTVSELMEANDATTGRWSASQADLARVQAYYADTQTRLYAAQSAHRQDIGIIGECLIGEAADRDWCDEYDRAIERINRQLTVELPHREPAEREYVVTITGTLSFTHTVTVTATDEDTAQEYARDEDGWTYEVERGRASGGYSDVTDEPEYSADEA